MCSSSTSSVVVLARCVRALFARASVTTLNRLQTDHLKVVEVSWRWRLQKPARLQSSVFAVFVYVDVVRSLLQAAPNGCWDTVPQKCTSHLSGASPRVAQMLYKFA